MSAYAEDLGKRALLSQAYLIAYSAIAALVGRGKLLWLIIFLFFVVMVLLQTKLGKGPVGQGKVRVEEIEEGRTLHEEKNIRELQLNDQELAKEMYVQSKATMTMSLGMFVALGYFFILWNKIEDIESYFVNNWGLNIKLALFLAFLIYFEGYFVISQLFMLYSLRRVGKMPVINMPQGFKITSKGIILQGIIGRQAIKFPLPEDIAVEVNERRKFVELVRVGKRSITRIRLYTRSPRKVYDLIVRLNERARKG